MSLFFPGRHWARPESDSLLQFGRFENARVFEPIWLEMQILARNAAEGRRRPSGRHSAVRPSWAATALSLSACNPFIGLPSCRVMWLSELVTPLRGHFCQNPKCHNFFSRCHWPRPNCDRLLQTYPEFQIWPKSGL